MLTPDELVSTAPERPALEAFLDMYRDIVVRKVRGLSDDDARRRLVDSGSTLGGLIKHLRQVEFDWFHTVLAQRPESALPIKPLPDDPPDIEFVMESTDTLDQLVADYRTACAHSRAIAAEFGLEDAVPHRRMGVREATASEHRRHPAEETPVEQPNAPGAEERSERGAEQIQEVTLRWIYIHMIEETARHAGHIDILRELIDGRTGFDDID